MPTRDLSRTHILALAKIEPFDNKREPPFQLPIKQVNEFNQSVLDAEAKISAIIKTEALNFLSKKISRGLQMELWLLLNHVYNKGYDNGLKTNIKISEL